MERGTFMSAGIGKRRHLTEAGFVVMWSSGFIGASLGTPEASTPTLMVWRFLLAAGLLWRRPVGERLARGYQNVLMSPILVKERGRPSGCSAGCPALVGWLDWYPVACRLRRSRRKWPLS